MHTHTHTHTHTVGEDYNAVNASVIFEPRSENIIQEFIGTLAPDDVFPEANKSFEIFLTASPGAYLFPDTVVMVTILNDDPPLPGETGLFQVSCLAGEQRSHIS